MSLDIVARHKGNSDITDGFLEIIRQLGIWIESLTGTNPDAGFDSFSAANYNHGNRSEQADLIEEVILRLQEINSIGPGGGNGGGKAEDNKIRISAEDTVSKTWDELFGDTNEIQWGKIEADETFGERIRLLAKLCFTAGQRAYFGGIPTVPEQNLGKVNIVAEQGMPPIVIQIGNRVITVTAQGHLQFEGPGNLVINNMGGEVQIGSQGQPDSIIISNDVLLAKCIRNTNYTTLNQVNVDMTIGSGQIVRLQNGTLVKKI